MGVRSGEEHLAEEIAQVTQHDEESICKIDEISAASIDHLSSSLNSQLMKVCK
jgi:hypothetical protein